MNDTTFIYGLFDPRDCRLRYIGKSNNPQKRLKQHIKEANDKKKRNRYVANWIRQLLSENLEPSIEILEEVSIDSWEEAESAWIADCKKFGLKITNGTSGGDGVKNLSPESIERMRRANLGKKCSEKQKQYMSALFKGRVSPNKGNKHTEEAKRKISEAGKGRKLNEEQIRALSERNQWRGKGFMKGKIFTQEHKDKISESHLGGKNPMFGKVQSEETIRKRVEKIKGQKRSDEFRKASSERQKGKKLTEEHKESLRLAWIKRKEKYGKTKFKRVGD